MPKDRDVWDPPEDVESPELPLSAFKQHFQGRAITVGKDGTNAQLVEMKGVKPIKWSKKKKDEAVDKPPRNTAVHKSRVSGAGIVAPDEIAGISRKPLPQREALITGVGGHVVNATKSAAHLLKNNVTGVRGGITRQELEPTMKNIVSRRTVSSHSSNDCNIAKRVDQQESLCKAETPEIISVEMVENDNSATGERIRYSLSAPQSSQSLRDGLVQRRRQPFSRLPPRRLNERAELMPQPSRSVTEYVKNKQECLEDDIDSNTIEEEHDNHSASFATSGDTGGESEVFPMYKPLGLLFSPLQLIKKKETKTATQSRSRQSGHRVCDSRQPQALARQNAKPLPFTGHAAKRVNAVPVDQKLSTGSQTTSPVSVFFLEPIRGASSSRTDATLADDLEKHKKKPITYKPHTMKDYKEMMGKVVNMKRGGLGPADTDEQRQAKDKMSRQRAYGERVERQTLEELHEKQKIHLQRQHGEKKEEEEEEDEEKKEREREKAPKMIKQPPRPEQVEAKERRARALAYARSLPRPEPAAAPKSADEEGSEARRSPERPNPRREMEWRREKHIRDLEVRHQRDRETLEYVKKQLGHMKK